MTKITKALLGNTKDGREVDEYTLQNASGAFVRIATFGGCITAICVPDKNGVMADICLGIDRVDAFEQPNFYLGALIGRCANRIEDAQFELNGKTYHLTANEGKNHLHGNGLLSERIWDARVRGDALVLTTFSPDGEEGYPGNVSFTVTYTFDDENALGIRYQAETDQDTVLNLTNHCYFNLAGHDSGDILDHEVQISADSYTVSDETLLPTGEIAPVDGTPLDFRSFRRVGDGIGSDFDQIVLGNGYDLNYVLNRPATTGMFRCAQARAAGRRMEVFTNMPGLQFYTGNFLDGTVSGKGGCRYPFRSGLCFETQFFPNSMRHPSFPSPVFRAGEKYDYTTVYRFSPDDGQTD